MNVLVVQRQSLVAGVNFSLSVYARIIEAMEWLADHGLAAHAVCGEHDEAFGKALRWADVVIFNKHFSDNALLLAAHAKKAGCLTILDLDDLVTDFPAYSGGSSTMNTTFMQMLAGVDRVTVANERLLEAIRPLRQDCTLIPNGIYVEKYPVPVMEEASPPRCVFTNADYLKMQSFKREFIRVLQDFHAAHPEVIFDFFGDPFPELASLPFLHYTRRIPYTEYIRCLAKTGYCFAITPLGCAEDAANQRFNECKNPFKYLNYGVAGIPGIFSDSIIYRECVKNCLTGFIIPNSYEAWRNTMELLYLDDALRYSMREKIYTTVKDRYHISITASNWLNLFS